MSAGTKSANGHTDHIVERIRLVLDAIDTDRPAGSEQRLLAMAAAIWHDTLTGAPSKRSLIAYDH